MSNKTSNKLNTLRTLIPMNKFKMPPIDETSSNMVPAFVSSLDSTYDNES